MFERATRERFRFDSPQGLLTTEDLWNLPLSSPTGSRANLDDIAKGLNKKLKALGDEESFVTEKRTTDDVTPVMFEIVKHIIKVRLAEADVRKKARENSEKKQAIMAIIAKKQNEKLEGTSLEELQAMVEAL
jgi:hypothetical protein